MMTSTLTEQQKNYVKNIVEGEACSDLRRPTYRYSPEQKLWSACLYEAVQTYLGLGTGVSAEERKKTRGWFTESFNGRGSSAGSYEWICHVLDIEPAPFRRMLVKVEEKACGDKRVARQILVDLRKGFSIPVSLEQVND